MTDFLTRISRAALGLTPVVQVLGAPRYAPGRPVPDARVFGSEEREVEVPFVAQASAPASLAMTSLPHDAPAIETNPSPAAREVPAQDARERVRDIRAAETSSPVGPMTIPRDRVVKDEAIRRRTPPPPTVSGPEQPRPVPAFTTLASSHEHAHTEAADRSGIGDDSVSRRESEIEAIEIEDVHESDTGASRRTATDEAVHERDTPIGSPAPKRVAAVVRSPRLVAAASRVKSTRVQNTPGNGELSAPANEHRDRPAQHPGDEIIETPSPRPAQQSADEIIEIASHRAAQQSADEIIESASHRAAQQSADEIIESASPRAAQQSVDEIIEIASHRAAQQSVDEIIEIPSSSRRSGRGPVPAPLPDFHETPSAQPPIVRVTIGRIDVRAAAPPAPPPAPQPAPGPRLSLDDYLRQHSGRSR